MSLNTGKPILLNDLLEIFTSEASATEKPEESRQRIANKLADAIDKFVRSGEVKVTVATTGTATAQTGTGTGNIT
ncbi:hypothetical protein OK18_19070 [Chryseobacterium gallinarum]|uniref:Uncharacterized protein n=1 Tax=Chryseobacterium gallinarum TaxID=1324352 RepID=A0A0G3M6A6_CHRGL|nr:hypothetical protein [Chryseobacterium gallinarum]AKK74434.1 hypothetical protein OK18_19070 [Chryseobacterium gallinarum]